MDTRKDRGDFYPGGETGGSAPGPQQSDKVDRVNLGEVGDEYTLKDVKQKVDQIVRVIAPAAVGMMLMLGGAIGIGAAGFSTRRVSAATAPLEDIPNNSPVVTNEEDSVALAKLATATNALQASTSAAMSELRSDMNTASNNLSRAMDTAIASESNRVEATYAKRNEIPAVPDLSPYALKSEIRTDYLTESDITNFATRAWINGQGYATEGTVYARIGAQNLALGAATNEMWQAMRSGTNRLWEAQAAASNRLNMATNAVWTAMVNGTNSVWQGVRAASNELARADARLDAKIDALELTGGMTRLWSSDATTYQDATGVVWQVQVVTGQWTVVHSWTTTGLNWDGPWWWGAEGAGEDYYEGTGWYISSSTLTPMRMSEYPYEKEIVCQWSYWDEQEEQEHSITTTCSRTVQWLTNAVNRVAYTNELEAASNTLAQALSEMEGRLSVAIEGKASIGRVEEAASGGTNYTDTVAADIRQNYIPISGGPIYSSVELFLNNVLHEQRMLQFELPDGTSADAQSFVGSSQMTNQGAVAAATAMAARKQDALPYPTNAIPFSAIDGAPSGVGQEWTVSTQDCDFVQFVTNGMAHVRWWNSNITEISDMTAWPDGASMMVRFAKQQPITSWSVATYIRLVGYGTWPTNDFQSVWWRSGTNIYVNVILEE